MLWAIQDTFASLVSITDHGMSSILGPNRASEERRKEL
jgi:hypothetical protein